MTNTGLIIYEALLEITTFSWKKYYIKEKNRQALENDLANKKFLNIWGSIINVASIDTIDLARPEFNKIESLIAHIQDEWIKNEIRRMVKLKTDEYKEQGKKMTDIVLQNIINKYTNE